MHTKIIYATTNPGKFREVHSLYAEKGIDIQLPGEFGAAVVVEETGSSLEENAILKAESYRDLLGEGFVVVGDDTGVEIDALGGEPGIRVRRWKGYQMADGEIIEHCLERMKDVPVGKRQAHFRTVCAVALMGHQTHTFEGKLDGEIVTDPGPQRITGFPFEPLFYVTKYRKMLGDIYFMPAGKRAEFPTHRHAAVNATVPYLRQLLGQD